MKEMLTKVALIAGVLFLVSCGMFSQKQADGPVVQEKVEKKQGVKDEASASSPSHASIPVSTRSASSPSVRPEYGSSRSSLYGDAPSGGPEILPGDFRGGMRAPDLPNKLPMTLDGKINTTPSSSQ